MAEIDQDIDDSVSALDFVALSGVSLVLVDGVGVDDEVAVVVLRANEASFIGVDVLDVSDTASRSREAAASVSDTLSATDSVTTRLDRTSVLTDTVAVTDSLEIARNHELQLSDAAVVNDSLVVTPTIALKIDDARALTATRVRIDFEYPVLINDALTRPSSYRFDNLSAASVEIVPLSVSLPAGQTNPLYVEVETTEHTNGATYEVALTAGIMGAAGEIGSPVPVSFTGIGIPPTLQLVLAVSAIEVQVYFSEAIANEADANDPRNYTWDGGLHTVAVRSVVGNIVTLQTSPQTPGELYHLTVTRVRASLDVTINDDAIDAEDEDVFVELFTLDIVVHDDIDTEDSIAAQVPPQQLLMVVGRYLAPSDESGVQSSLDGTVWIAESGFSADGLGLLGAAFGNGVNCVSASSATYTSDGRGTWVGHYGLGEIQGIAFSPELGIFVAGGHNLFFVSTDGASWTTTPADVSPSDVYFFSIAWSPELGLFVAGGNDANLIQTSPDGYTWTRHAQGGSFFGLWWGMCWCSGLGLFVGAGGNSAAPDSLQTSPDGAAWTVRTPGSGYTGNWLACAASDSRIVIAGWSGMPEVQTSDDGITWTRRTLANSYSGTPNGLTYRADLGLFVLCGDGAEIQTSPDGITWTHRTPGGGVTDAQFRGVG